VERAQLVVCSEAGESGDLQATDALTREPEFAGHLWVPKIGSHLQSAFFANGAPNVDTPQETIAQPHRYQRFLPGLDSNSSPVSPVGRRDRLTVEFTGDAVGPATDPPSLLRPDVS
jgi:hypothetical protein